MRILPGLGLLALLACSSNTPALGADPANPSGLSGQRLNWDGPDLLGISGMCKDADGRFFAVAEKVRKLFPFELSERGHRPAKPIEILGVPKGVDLESVACLPDGRLMFGTEVLQTGRTQDKILVGKLDDSARLTLKPALTFDYRPFSITASRNRGIEGLCYADGFLIAASEHPIEGEKRYAPLGIYDMANKRWRYARAELSSKTGKISALNCGRGRRSITVLAIERHYEVVRVLRYTIPLMGPPMSDLEPELLEDLGPHYKTNPPNFEGLERLAGRLVLISDNDYGGKSGPTQLLMFKPTRKLPTGFMGTAR